MRDETRLTLRIIIITYNRRIELHQFSNVGWEMNNYTPLGWKRSAICTILTLLFRNSSYILSRDTYNQFTSHYLTRDDWFARNPVIRLSTDELSFRNSNKNKREKNLGQLLLLRVAIAVLVSPIEKKRDSWFTIYNRFYYLHPYYYTEIIGFFCFSIIIIPSSNWHIIKTELS